MYMMLLESGAEITNHFTELMIIDRSTGTRHKHRNQGRQVTSGSSLYLHISLPTMYYEVVVRTVLYCHFPPLRWFQ